MADDTHQPLGVNHVVERSTTQLAKLAFFSFILAWVLTRAQPTLRLGLGLHPCFSPSGADAEEQKSASGLLRAGGCNCFLNGPAE